MSKFYSASRHGFFDRAIHGADGIPADAVEITDDEWRDLLDRQCRDGVLAPDPVTGRPVIKPHGT